LDPLRYEGAGEKIPAPWDQNKYRLARKRFELPTRQEQRACNKRTRQLYTDSLFLHSSLNLEPTQYSQRLEEELSLPAVFTICCNLNAIAYHPVRTNQLHRCYNFARGTLRIPAGQVGDPSLLNTFDWFVEGVIANAW
jgi:hypothetical protein